MSLPFRCGGLGLFSRFRDFFLLLIVLDGGLNRVFREHRAVNLHGRQGQLFDNLGVFDSLRLLDRFALEPFGREAAGSDRGAATERLELRVLDDSRDRVHLDLQLHHVTALWRADEACPDRRIGRVEAADVPRVAVVIENLVAVWHIDLHQLDVVAGEFGPANVAMNQCAAHSIFLMSMPCWTIS
jgi:hypothetical protein